MTKLIRHHRLVALTILLAALTVLPGHVGTNTVFWDGLIGPYQSRVIVRPPGVVPGLAQITIRLSDLDVTRVTVQPLRWDTGAAGAPPPDEAQPVAGTQGLYSADLWLMMSGSHSIRVALEGPQGKGVVNIPVLSVATETLGMSRGMGAALLLLGLLLFAGAVSVIGAAVRESIVPPGAAPPRRRVVRARVAMTVTTVLLGLAVYGGNTWWAAVDAAYQASLYQPMEVSADVRPVVGGQALRLAITDPEWYGPRWTPLIPDHGKLMHLFAIREDLGAFAHLHPVSVDSSTFDVLLPPLPPGRYRIYGDVTHESGFAQTLVDTVLVTTPAEATDTLETLAADPDDSWYAGGSTIGAEERAAGQQVALSDSLRMTWQREAYQPETPTTLTFTVQDAHGEAVVLDPYMGMLSHLAVTRTDGSVFMHVHPAGSISMAAQARFNETPSAPMDHRQHRTETPTQIDFPFEFPKAGAYRIWVQVKHEGTVYTGAFDVDIPEA